MLKEIRCIHFKNPTIQFHLGFNVILGDDDAKNSIGKSTALMIIDFVFGGTSFLKDDAGAIRALGHHHYDFSFEFAQRELFFSRATDTPDLVYVCDRDYKRLNDLPIEDYKAMLKNLYDLSTLTSSFRAVVSPFTRIWRKGGFEPDQPFASSPKESGASAISRLIDLFEHSSGIAAEKKALEQKKERKALINNSMNENLIPKINKTKYDENTKLISDNQLQLDQLRYGISGTLTAYESLFDENLQKKRYKKNDLSNQRAALHHTIRRLEREIAGITPRLAANIALLADYFPALDVSRLEEVEAFHQKIGSIVKKELKEELRVAIAEDVDAADEIKNIDREIQSALHAKGMPDDVFNRVFTLKEITDKAIEENKSFERKIELDDAIKISNERLGVIYTEIFSNIENKLNIKLKSFNRVVYGPSRASSELHIKGPSSYRFTSEADTGTGKSYAGLIGFDLAMLSLTRLPLVIHDSIIYKNIEISATRRILRILSSIRSKQIFISFDEAKKFGAQAEKLLSKFSVLRLTRDNLLYTSDWRNNNN